jgi:hypothetical protein
MFLCCAVDHRYSCISSSSCLQWHLARFASAAIQLQPSVLSCMRHIVLRLTQSLTLPVNVCAI